MRNAAEVQNEQTRRTRLWERSQWRDTHASPFGVVFRPRGGQPATIPFITWHYRPSYLPPSLSIEFADNVPLVEPELIYLPFAHRSGPPPHEPTHHALPLHYLSRVVMNVPTAHELSEPARAVQSAGLITYRHGDEPLVEVVFATYTTVHLDLRPDLPLVLRSE